MLCCPARSPLSNSRRLPGGAARSPNTSALCNCRSLRCATRWRSAPIRRENGPWNRASASRSAKDRIIDAIMNAWRCERQAFIGGTNNSRVTLAQASLPVALSLHPEPTEHHGQQQRHPRRLPRLLRPQRAPGGRKLAAGAAQRPDADVHQRRHGAVQERVHRPGEAALSSAPPRRRNASAPAASTTTWTTSATPRATTPSSRCWGISASATTSRKRRSPMPGSW